MSDNQPVCAVCGMLQGVPGHTQFEPCTDQTAHSHPFHHFPVIEERIAAASDVRQPADTLTSDQITAGAITFGSSCKYLAIYDDHDWQLAKYTPGGHVRQGFGPGPFHEAEAIFVCPCGASKRVEVK